MPAVEIPIIEGFGTLGGKDQALATTVTWNSHLAMMQVHDGLNRVCVPTTCLSKCQTTQTDIRVWFSPFINL
jgi:hypothetical protein